MNCPRCETPTLFDKKIEDSLRVRKCKNCEGYWLPSSEYCKWKETQEEQPIEDPGEVEFDINDTKKATICPDCGHILIKYKIGYDVSFRVDHCNSCNGVWLDKNEWEALRAKNLHIEIRRIFTAEWQRHVRQEKARAYLESLYSKRFGDDYEKIKRFKSWLDEDVRRPFILAYLSDRDPYKI